MMDATAQCEAQSSTVQDYHPVNVNSLLIRNSCSFNSTYDRFVYIYS